jgi:hypothetical protein
MPIPKSPLRSASADTATIAVSEDAWSGTAAFILYLDGKAFRTPQAGPSQPICLK